MEVDAVAAAMDAKLETGMVTADRALLVGDAIESGAAELTQLAGPKRPLVEGASAGAAPALA
jgi:hypothetical protein